MCDNAGTHLVLGEVNAVLSSTSPLQNAYTNIYATLNKGAAAGYDLIAALLVAKELVFIL